MDGRRLLITTSSWAACRWRRLFSGSRRRDPHGPPPGAVRLPLGSFPLAGAQVGSDPGSRLRSGPGRPGPHPVGRPGSVGTDPGLPDPGSPTAQVQIPSDLLCLEMNGSPKF